MASREVDEARRHHELLLAELQRQGKRILDVDGVDALVGSRTPVVVCGFSHYGHAPFPPACIEDEARALVAQLGSPEREILITGGTDVGFEGAVHHAARRSGHAIVGFIHRGALAGEIGAVGVLTFAGAYQDWSAPLFAALGFAAARGGCAVFVGGGPTVGAGILHARRLGMPCVLVGRAPGLAGEGGASAQAAERLAPDERARCVLQTLRDLARIRRGLTPGTAACIEHHQLFGSGDPESVLREDERP